MIAGPIPIVENMDKKLMITVAIATTPKSFGANKRANTIETIRLTKNTEYFSIALQKYGQYLYCFPLLLHRFFTLQVMPMYFLPFILFV